MTRKLLLFGNLFLVVVLLLGTQVVTASAEDHAITRISGWNNSQPDGYSGEPAISADGHYILFDSNATNLIKGGLPKDPNLDFRSYIYNQKTGKTELVSVASDGSPSTGGGGTISSDGRYVAFGSKATIVAGDIEVASQAYLRDRATAKNYLVSAPLDGSTPNAASGCANVSDTGRYVAFVSYASNLIKEDADTHADVYIRDMQKNKLYLVSVSSAGQKGNANSGNSGCPSMSPDGRYVAFGSDANNLVPGDTNGVTDLFVHDMKTGQTERVSISSGGKQANNISEESAISGNGRYVAFWSMADNLVPGDTNGVSDVFLHDRQTNKTERASVSSNGKQENNASSGQIALSLDGRYISFASQATNLAKGTTIKTCPAGANGLCANIYLHDRQTGKTTLISISKNKTGGNNDSAFPSISRDGHWIVFNSFASNLVSGDTDGQSDIFVFHRGSD